MVVGSGESAGRIRVLHGLRVAAGTTSYVDQLVDGAAPDIEVSTFSWARALFASYDVLHVHRPELLVRHRTSAGRFVAELLGCALLLRLELNETPVVSTVHDATPYRPTRRLERRFVAGVGRRTTLWIRLDPTTRLPQGVRSMTIPHGHYRSVFPPDSGGRPEAGRICQPGQVGRGTGIEELLAVFGGIDDRTLRLTVVGPVSDAGLAERIAVVAAADHRIDARLGHVPDAELAREVRRAELVVLPHPEPHDCGAVLRALSLDRPVLVPRSAATDGLAREVGEGWVIMFDGVLQAGDLLRALALARLPRDRESRPYLDERDWEQIGRQHAEAYRKVVPHLAVRR